MRRIQDPNIGPGETFISANPGTNTPGTIVRKDHKNDVQEELCRAIESTGEAVDTTLYASGTGNRDQIAQMAAHYGAGGASYFIENVTSAADAYVIKPVQIAIRDRQAPAALFERQQIIFPPGFNNTGASTVDVSLLLGEVLGTTILDIKLSGGVTDPQAGDLIAGSDAVLIYRTTPTAHLKLENPASELPFIVASQAEAEAGVDNTKGMTPLRTREAIASSVIGEGQTWQNVTGSRNAGVTYTNTSGRPIMVYLRLGVSGGFSGNFTIGSTPLPISDGDFDVHQTTFIIPVGETYELDSFAYNLFFWHELR